MKIIVGTLLILSVLCSECNHAGFEKYVADFGKTYSSDSEKTMREQIYIQNCTMIEEHNSQNTEYTLGVNDLTDQTWEEIQRRLGIIVDTSVSRVSTSNLEIKVKAPSSVNWGNYCALTPVKNQGKCGCCWAFSAVAAAQSFIKINNGSDTDMSEEYVLECTEQSDCQGGFPNLAMDLIAANGTPSESQYPYKASGGSSTKPSTAGICSAGSSYRLPSNSSVFGAQDVSTSQIQSLIAASPIVTYFWAENSFYSYKSGVYSCSRAAEPSDLNHGVMVYGYDTSGNYFIKNSWGTGWGTGGYGTVSGSKDCGIRSLVYYYQTSSFQNVLTSGSCSAYPSSNNTDNNSTGFGGKLFLSVVLLLGFVMM